MNVQPSQTEFTPDQAAAHELLSELRTRISTQPLPYQYGIESRALESMWEVFDQARVAMKNHPGCEEFAKVTTTMLNVELRPLTAKWHRAQVEGRLKSRDGADEFRADLEAMQKRLRGFASELHKMAYGSAFSDELTGPAISSDEVDICFKSVPFGIIPDTLISSQLADCINKDEAAAVAARRLHHNVAAPEGNDAVGLALSGGGIRSATFCLGVTQVLAERNLLKDVDFLSTVSGGGYVGTFLTSRLGNGEPYSDVASPHGPDTEPVRYLRQHAKYLAASDLKEQWSMVTATIAGMILNWSAPLLVLALAAWVAVSVTRSGLIIPWVQVIGVAGSLSVISLIIYAAGMRSSKYTGGWLLGVSTAVTGMVVALWLLTIAYQHFDQFSWNLMIATAIGGSIASAPAVIRFIPVLQKPRVREWVLKGVLIAAGLVVPLGAVLLAFLFYKLGLLPEMVDGALWNPLRYGDGALVLVVVILVLGFISIFLLDINMTGPHRLYRDQLAKTFVQKGKSLQLPTLAASNPKGSAPYHLVNAAVNFPSSNKAALRERKSDFFLFSKKWCGAPSLGYKPANQWKAHGRPIDTATAMAVSGAAASPYMGLASFPSLTALLSFLNVRLGYWMLRPEKNARPRSPGFSCLLREMTGVAMSENEAWINISDGGHIENMGVYELLRRRCKFIISVDGEADPRSTFHGHLTLVRHAQIDFGIRIEPALADLRPDELSRFSQKHFILGRVKYPKAGSLPACEGLILYVKSTLTGNELELIKKYKSSNPEFPHQTTLDQFFDEEQFEVYRQLGVHVAEGLFSKALMSNTNPTSVPIWFRSLAEKLLVTER